MSDSKLTSDLSDTASQAMLGPNPFIGFRGEDVLGHGRRVEQRSRRAPDAHTRAAGGTGARNIAGPRRPVDAQTGARRQTIQRRRVDGESVLPNVPRQLFGVDENARRVHRQVELRRPNQRAGTFRDAPGDRRDVAQQFAGQSGGRQARRRDRRDQRRRRFAQHDVRPREQFGDAVDGRQERLRGRQESRDHRRQRRLPQRCARTHPVPAPDRAGLRDASTDRAAADQ